MSNALTLSVRGVKDEDKNNLFKCLISQKWGFISNLDVKDELAYVNIVNCEDKFPKEAENLSLLYKDKVLNITK